MKNATYEKYFAIVSKAHPAIKKDQITVYDEGWDHIIMVVNQTFAFRFPKTERYKKMIVKESSFLTLFAPKSPVQVPRLKLHNDDEISQYATYRFIPGVQFFSPVAKTFTKEELKTVAQRLGAFLTAIHSFPKRKAKELGIEEVNPMSYWPKRFEEVKKGVFPHISSKEQNWVTKLFETFLTTLRKSRIASTVIHGDIFPEHLIVDPKANKLTGIIDFADVGIDDPAYDFAFRGYYKDEFFQEVYRSYDLPRDAYFDKRRQFYEERYIITDLENSLKLNDSEKIANFKKRLTYHIK